MIARVRAGFDKVIRPHAMERGSMTGRHGAVHPPREGAGQPFSVTCPESASRRFRTVPASSVETGGFLPACSIQGGNTGATHEAAKRWVPEWE